MIGFPTPTKPHKECLRESLLAAKIYVSAPGVLRVPALSPAAQKPLSLWTLPLPSDLKYD